MSLSSAISQKSGLIYLLFYRLSNSPVFLPLPSPPPPLSISPIFLTYPSPPSLSQISPLVVLAAPLTIPDSFTLDKNTGLLSVNKRLDTETSAKYTIIVNAFDQLGVGPDVRTATVSFISSQYFMSFLFAVFFLACPRFVALSVGAWCSIHGVRVIFLVLLESTCLLNTYRLLRLL